MEEASGQSLGVKNLVVNLLAKKLKNYGKVDLRKLMKTCATDEVKSQYLIVDEIIKMFNIVCLEQGKRIMVYDKTHYSLNIKELDKVISAKAEFYNEGQDHMFKEVYTWIKKNLQIEYDFLCFDPKLIPFLNGYYDLDKDWLFHYDKDDIKHNFFYVIPHEFNLVKGLNGAIVNPPKCNLFKKSVVKWVDQKIQRFNPQTQRNDIFVKGYRKGKRKVLLNDIFEYIGLCMTLEVGFKSVMMCQGPKDSAKSQLSNIVATIIGTDNLSTSELYELTERFGSNAIQFKLLNLCGDMTDTAISKTGKFNLYTGGDKHIPGEIKGGENYKFPPTSKFWFNINLFPSVKNFLNTAFFDRFIVILFRNIYDKNNLDFDINFSNIIINDPNEIQGVIYESLEGLKRLHKRKGFRDELKRNTMHIWNYESNPVYRFLYDHTIKDKNGIIEIHEFWEKFTDLEGGGYSINILSKILEKMGYPKKDKKEMRAGKRTSIYYYFGLKWKVKSVNEANKMINDRIKNFKKGMEKKMLDEKKFEAQDPIDEPYDVDGLFDGEGD
jgi:phage/plasmid-associated DNA primase